MHASSTLTGLYPVTPHARHLYVTELGTCAEGTPCRVLGGQPTGTPEEAMFAVLQGLVNREEPRVYLCYGHEGKKVDARWPEYYARRFGLTLTQLDDPYELLHLFGSLVRGVILYDSEITDAINVAVMLSGRHQCLPVTPELQQQLRERYAWAGHVVDDLRGRFASDYEVARWAHEHLQPDCHRQILVHQHDIVPFIYDYVVAHNLFLFHASHSMKDRREAALADAIYQTADRPCHVMGWLDERMQECEYTARISRNGCYVTCNGRAPNLTIHSAINAAPRYEARALTPEQRTAERRVYIAFIVSDGDALWCLNSFFMGNFLQPERGDIPLTWEQQLVTAHLAPGMLTYYLEQLTPNDYPIASVSGAGYTYPNLHPDPRPYLAQTEQYLQLTGLRALYAGLSSPYDAVYWRDHEGQRRQMVDLYRQHVPSAHGIIRGYGGGGMMDEHSLEPGETPVVCATLLFGGRDREVLAGVQQVLADVDVRPLFISVHVTPWAADTTTLARVGQELQAQGCELLMLDAWFAKLEDAVAKGWLSEGLYPNRTAVLAQRQTRVVAQWHERVAEDFARVLRRSLLPPEELAVLQDDFPRIWGKGQPLNERQRTVTTLEDDLAFSVLFTAQVLADYLCQCLGYHANSLAQIAQWCRHDFRRLAGVDVLADCLETWMAWEERRVTIEEAQQWAQRMLQLLPEITAYLEHGGMPAEPASPTVA